LVNPTSRTCYKPLVTLPAETDVAIIGGGFAGCATAWALAERGIHAVVIEREPELGRHASGRGAGLGRQLAEDDSTTALTIRGARILRDLPAWRSTGGILGFDDPTHARAYVARAVRFEIPHEVISRDRVLRLWPALTGVSIATALYIPSDGVIDIKTLLATFAAGQTVITATDVTGVDAGRVETSRGTLKARVVVDAGGAWAGAATGDPALDAYKRHLFLLQGVPVAAETPFLWHLGVEELYVRPAGDAVLVSPCDALPTVACDQLPDATVEPELRRQLARIAPDLSGVPATAWACQRAFTGDRQFRLGRDPRRPWLVWAAGLGGHGATASAAVGQVVADAVIAALTT
jgi:glycine/D-amino acid oxidase-like deaminating enzyme